MIQTSFFEKPTLYHGGTLAKGRRKTLRTFSSREPMHLVLKAAKPILFENKELVLSLTERYAKKFGITIYGSSVQHDHIHYALRAHSRRSYSNYTRSLTGQLAKHLGSGLWKIPPFTRVVNWGNDFENLKKYIRKNEEEVLGFRKYEPRKHRYPGR